MTREHDALRDLLAPVALGAATRDEVARVEAHAAECAVCREELAGLRAASDVLALAVPQREPSPELRASLMATVRAEAAEREAAAERAAAQPPRRSGGERLRGAFGWVRPWPAIAAVAAVAALLLGVVVAVQSTGDQDGREVTELAVSGTPDAPGITGEVLYVPEEGTAVVRLRELPELARGDAYQLWVLRDGMPESAGLFEPDGPAQAIRVVEDLAGADALAVTAQPRTSRLMPEGPILVQAPLPA